jgi:hypothetical protein
MQFNLFKISRPKNYILDERERLEQLKFNNSIQRIFILIVCVAIMLNVPFSLFNIDMPFSFAILLFLIPNTIAPFLGIIKNINLSKESYILGMLSFNIIANRLIDLLNIQVNNNLTGIIVVFFMESLPMLIMYLLYMYYYNYHQSKIKN